jgi:uncharacterized delta-60 repeat protein
MIPANARQAISVMAFALLMVGSPATAGDVLRAGDLDPTFANAGSIAFPDTPSTAPSTVLSKSDGSLLVGNTYAVPRQLDAGGVPDPGYRWTDGRDDMYRRCVSLGGGCQVNAVALQGDERLVAGLTFRALGPDGTFRFAVARFNVDGTLDTTFGSGGIGLTDPVGDGNVTSTMILLPDGKLLAGGATFPLLIGNQLAFARFMQDGSADRSFGQGGVVTTMIDGLPQTLLPQSDGSVVVVAVIDAGPAASQALPKTLLVRLLPTGGLDPSFGEGGSITLQFDGLSTWPSKAVLEPDGRILLALRHGSQFTLMRLFPSGTADGSFGNAGKVVAQVGEPDSASQAEDIALQADGKILVVGTVEQAGGPLGFRRIAVARFNPDGSLDPFFAPGGVTLAWSKFGAEGSSLVIQPGGRIVVSGAVEDPPYFYCCDLGGGAWLQNKSLAVFGFIGGDAAFARPTRQAKAIEYYHSGFDHYFVTANAYEVAVLDTDPVLSAAWMRTGLAFRVYSEGAAAGLSPVCRFFSGASFAPKSSHFYTPYSSECGALMTSPVWLYEGVVFYLQLPNDHALCPEEAAPLYRLYNDGQGGAPNHRYTTSGAVFDQMIGKGWIFEGDAQTRVFACVPT